MTKALVLTREEILAFRRRAGSLDERLPPGEESRRKAAGAGLQDSMPRSALLSLHARVEQTAPSSWEEAPLVQLWGPRYSVFVIARSDVALFSISRLPDKGTPRKRAEELAPRLRALLLENGSMTYREAGEALGVNPNALRYAALTGGFLIRWEGARAPMVWSIPPPEIDAETARLELARRFLHLYGPSTAASFAIWAGIKPPVASMTFSRLRTELIDVETPIGSASLLSEDEGEARAERLFPAPARLLPSGDSYFLLQGGDRHLLVEEEGLRRLLWTPRVWPGAVLVGGEVVGTWRRSDTTVAVQLWRKLRASERQAVAEEATSLPLGGQRSISVTFD